MTGDSTTTRVLRRADSQTVVWMVLLAATLLTAVVGLEQHGSARPVGLLLLAVAFVKLRLVGLHFMELRTAPAPLRLLFEGYVAAVFLVLTVMYAVL